MSTGAPGGPIDVVFHTSEADRAATAFGNARNLLEDGRVDLGTVAVVVNGAAISAVRADADLAAAVGDLVAVGVEMRACANTLARRGASAEELHEGVDVVPSAMGELARRQAAGAAYIRP